MAKLSDRELKERRNKLLDRAEDSLNDSYTPWEYGFDTSIRESVDREVVCLEKLKQVCYDNF